MKSTKYVHVKVLNFLLISVNARRTWVYHSECSFINILLSCFGHKKHNSLRNYFWKRSVLTKHKNIRCFFAQIADAIDYRWTGWTSESEAKFGVRPEVPYFHIKLNKRNEFESFFPSFLLVFFFGRSLQKRFQFQKDVDQIRYNRKM